MTRTELLAIAKPIPLNTEEVRAIIDGRKKTIRRCVKPKSKNAYGFFVTERVSDGAFMGVYDYDEDENAFDNPQKQPAYTGDILYVKETWSEHYTADSDGELVYCYKADGVDLKSECLPGENNRWWQSTYMPKEAARVFLQVTGVRVEKLNEISLNDILSDGIVLRPEAYNDPDNAYLQAVNAYETLWNTTVKKSDLDRYGWDANPYVWVIEFERVEVENES